MKKRGSTATYFLFALVALYLSTFYLYSSIEASIFPSTEEINAPTKYRSTTSNLHVFYNIYIAETKEGKTTAKKIIKEQLYGLSSRVPERIEVHYTTTGSIPTEEEDIVDCPEDLTCVHDGHHDQGFEELTLAKAHQHCSKHPKDRIIYMHSKGSFHDNNDQKAWRTIMLDSVTSLECQRSLTENRCDVCGFLFHTPWAPLFPGNVFTARCDYIQKLHHPDSKFESEYRHAVDLANKTGLRFSLFKPMPWNLGSERYAAEHWIGTHPSLRACDMSSVVHVQQAFRSRNSLKWSMAPRFPIQANWFLKSKKLKKLMSPNSKSNRLKEYYLLPGLLVKYFTLYKEYPSNSSWVWDWYPDGDYWKEQVELVNRSKLIEFASP